MPNRLLVSWREVRFDSWMGRVLVMEVLGERRRGRKVRLRKRANSIGGGRMGFSRLVVVGGF